MVEQTKDRLGVPDRSRPRKVMRAVAIVDLVERQPGPVPDMRDSWEFLDVLGAAPEAMATDQDRLEQPVVV